MTPKMEYSLFEKQNDGTFVRVSDLHLPLSVAKVHWHPKLMEYFMTGKGPVRCLKKVPYGSKMEK